MIFEPYCKGKRLVIIDQSWQWTLTANGLQAYVVPKVYHMTVLEIWRIQSRDNGPMPNFLNYQLFGLLLSFIVVSTPFCCACTENVGLGIFVFSIANLSGFYKEKLVLGASGRFTNYDGAHLWKLDGYIWSFWFTLWQSPGKWF